MKTSGLWINFRNKTEKTANYRRVFSIYSIYITSKTCKTKARLPRDQILHGKVPKDKHAILDGVLLCVGGWEGRAPRNQR